MNQFTPNTIKVIREFERIQKKICRHKMSIMFNEICIYIYIYIYILNNHHHHHIVLVARISLTLSRHFSLSFITSGWSSGLHPVSSHNCWMYVRAGRPAFDRPCVDVHKSISLMSYWIKALTLRGKNASNSKIKIYNESLSRGKNYWKKKEKANLVTPIEKNQQIGNRWVKRKKNTVNCC